MSFVKKDDERMVLFLVVGFYCWLLLFILLNGFTEMQHSWFHLWIFIWGGQVAVDSADFDFTLLYKLIRNLVTGIPAPTRGWGSPPCCSNEADNIERIRFLRNLLAHNTKLEISDADFSIHWTDLSEVKLIYNYHTIPIC